MASTTKQMNITAGNAQATVNATVNDSMPAIPCPDPAGYRYVGARYVPLFADPLQWSSANTYEPLTIVVNEGNSYTSRTYVPVGIDISNTDYWALTGNYNAQVEQYRQEVQAFDDRISEAQENATAALNPRSLTNGRNIVVLGDSFCDPSYFANVWPVILENDYGYTVHNYAVRGAGFVTKSGIGSSTIVTQAIDASSDDEYDHNLIQDVIIYAGYNDFINNSVDVDTAIANAETAVSTVRTSFPNATIKLFTITMGQYSGITLDKWQNIIAFQRGIQNIPGIFCKDATCWLARIPRQENVCESDKEFIHPNANGHILLAKWINQGYADPYSFTLNVDDIYGDSLSSNNATINSFNANSNAKLYGDIDENGIGQIIFDSIGSCNASFESNSTVSITLGWKDSASAYFVPMNANAPNLAAANTNTAQMASAFNGTTGLITYVSPQTMAAQNIYWPKIYMNVNMRNHALSQLR